MSSAILYLAIVAIWAVVLVPRWLRHPHAAPQPAQMHEEEPLPASGQHPAVTAAAGGGLRAPHADAGAGSAAGPGAVPPARRHHPRAGPGQRRAPGPASPSPAARRARILRARRRTLSTLLLLAAGAAGLAVAHLAAWWVTIPPAVMLAGFLLLLRAAASVDAQRAAARAHAASQRRAEAQARHEAAAQARHEAAAAVEEPWDDGEQADPAAADAEIIDISARVSDQLYDQYTDAQARAIGD